MARVEELGKALCEVRKAHRIIYAYQKRMMDLARFIGAKLDMPECQVIKHYSNSPSKKISAGTWAWDFLYTYLMEYYLGEKQTIDKNGTFGISLFQFSDTGFFDSDKSHKSLMFFIEYIPNGTSWKWYDKIKEVINDKKYASSEHTQSVLKEGESIIGIYSVNIKNFVDEMHTMQVLRNFCKYCYDNGIAEISLI